MWREVTCTGRFPTMVERTAALTDSPNGVVSEQSNVSNGGVQRLWRCIARRTQPDSQHGALGGVLSVRTLRRSPVPSVLTANRAVPGEPGSPDHPPKVRPRLRAAAVALGLGAAAAIAVFIAWAPWPVGFGVAIAGAIGWCLWLEGHTD